LVEKPLKEASHLSTIGGGEEPDGGNDVTVWERRGERKITILYWRFPNSLHRPIWTGEIE